MTGATLVYSGRTTNWPVIAVAVGGGLALVLFGRPWLGPWPGMIGPLAIAFGALAVGLVTSTSLRVTTGPRGVQVRCGAFGWPRFAFPARAHSQRRDRDCVDLAVVDMGDQLDTARRLGILPALGPRSAIDTHQRPSGDDRSHRSVSRAGRTRHVVANGRTCREASGSDPQRPVRPRPLGTARARRRPGRVHRRIGSGAPAQLPVRHAGCADARRRRLPASLLPEQARRSRRRSLVAGAWPWSVANHKRQQSIARRTHPAVGMVQRVHRLLPPCGSTGFGAGRARDRVRSTLPRTGRSAVKCVVGPTARCGSGMLEIGSPLRVSEKDTSDDPSWDSRKFVHELSYGILPRLTTSPIAIVDNKHRSSRLNYRTIERWDRRRPNGNSIGPSALCLFAAE